MSSCPYEKCKFFELLSGYQLLKKTLLHEVRQEASVNYIR
jgi:hypothetical protein